MRLDKVITGLVGVLLATALSSAGAMASAPAQQRGDGGGVARAGSAMLTVACGDRRRMELSVLPSRRAGHVLIRVQARGADRGELARGFVHNGGLGDGRKGVHYATFRRRADDQGSWHFQKVLVAEDGAELEVAWRTGGQFVCGASQTVTMPMSGTVSRRTSRHLSFFSIRRTDQPGTYRIVHLMFVGDIDGAWLMSIGRNGHNSVSSASQESPNRYGVLRADVVFRLHGDRTLRFAALGPDGQRARFSLRRTWP